MAGKVDRVILKNRHANRRRRTYWVRTQEQAQKPKLKAVRRVRSFSDWLKSVAKFAKSKMERERIKSACGFVQERKEIPNGYVVDIKNIFEKIEQKEPAKRGILNRFVSGFESYMDAIRTLKPA